MKQTAVEWFSNQLGIKNGSMLEQAKQLEKQQIIDAFDEGQEYEYQYHINNAPKFDSETYFAETYGSNGSDDTLKEYHIVDTNEMVDQVPDVRKMVEDDNYLTPVDWLMDRIKWIHRETYDYLIKEGQYDVAKRTENAILNKANELQSSQTEISDKEIEKLADEFALKYYTSGVTEDEVSAFVTGMKWYREQLKKKQ